jgi:hypothetical protein
MTALLRISVRYLLALTLTTSIHFNLVPEAGLEPARLAARDFKSLASTNFTTQAKYKFTALLLIYSIATTESIITVIAHTVQLF